MGRSCRFLCKGIFSFFLFQEKPWLFPKEPVNIRYKFLSNQLMMENKKIKKQGARNSDNNSQTQKRRFKKIEGRNAEKPDRKEGKNVRKGGEKEKRKKEK